MPDSSKRIHKTSIGAMNNVLFLLNSLHPNANPLKHPKLIVIFNDQSKFMSVETDQESIRLAIAKAFQNKRIGYLE